jgi:hypothetical protein
MNQRVSEHLPHRRCGSVNDQDVSYAAALRLVEQIDSHLCAGTRHYYDTQGRLLTTLDGVVEAILTDTLKTERGISNESSDVQSH